MTEQKETVTMGARPELGDIKVGDAVIVKEGGTRTGRRYAATVASAARVWLTMKSDTSRLMWRMRRDTQNTDFGYSSDPRFVTLEQDAWDRRVRDAQAYLSERGVKTEFRSEWDRGDRIVALAEAVRGIPDEQ